jgi:acyl-[acyl-carrier-protein]-phospholipid O-acyltransferase/long-chain-fatty-acid--[acyl-carrier-protein] ligase
MSGAHVFDAAKAETTLMGALARARRRRGGKHVVIEDFDGRALTYDDVTKGAYALGSALARRTGRGETVGVMMPTGAPGFISVLALSAYGRVPTMMNFTAGLRALRAACDLAKVGRIVTARGFIEKAGLQELAGALGAHAELIYLEDVRAGIDARDKAMAGLGLTAPALLPRAKPSDTAIILFTSGTEGDAKGVALSHRAIVANVLQVRAHFPEFTDHDIFFNPLPIFHSFGLIPGGLLPLLSGMKTALHPTPLQPREIAARVKETKATILLGSDTFVSQYARAGDEGSLSSLRFAVCGAERVKDETRALLRRKYGVVLLEGYGVTETAPVVSVNVPSDNRPGTVGRLMPGIEARIEPVEGIDGAGRLLVRGPNIMSGYLLPSAPGIVQPPKEGWHDTGDVVSIDEDGYLRIHGRLKRFAKIGGEMVSLAICENCASTLWPDVMHAAATLADGRKGEQIVLLSESAEANRADLLAFIQGHGAPELAAPKRVIKVEKIPLLSTGKTDFVAVQKLAMSFEAQSAEGQSAEGQSAPNAK